MAGVTFVDIATWIARAIGVLYLGGAFAVFMLLRVTWLAASLERQLDPDASRRGGWGRTRIIWLAAGGVLTALSGAALIALSRFSPWLLGVLVAHQAVYLPLYAAKARREGDLDQAPADSTIRAAGWSVAVLGVSLYLLREGVLR